MTDIAICLTANLINHQQKQEKKIRPKQMQNMLYEAQ